MTQRYPTIVGHNDVLLRLYEQERKAALPGSIGDADKAAHFDFFAHNQQGDIDLPRARQGDMAGGFFAAYVPSPAFKAKRYAHDGVPADKNWSEEYLLPALAVDDARAFTIAQTARLFRLAAASQGQVQVVHTVQQLTTCLEQGTLAAILHIEGIDGLDTNFELLEVLYQAGLRSLGIVWSRPNAFAHGVPLIYPHSPDTGPGLTDAGRELIKACNRLGIMIDLSHLNEQGFWDVARLSDAPLVATHSNAYAICPSTRNLTDRQLSAIQASQGVVGVNFNVCDIRADGRLDPATPLTDLIQHIDYLVEHMGIDHVAIGTDFDGAMMPEPLSDVSKLPVLFQALQEHGYDQDALAKIASGNWLRVLRTTWK